MNLQNSVCHLCFSLCWGRPFKVYVYPEDPKGDLKETSGGPSPDYLKVLDSIRRSPLYTPDPGQVWSLSSFKVSCQG